jgi:hypothetical protein
MGKISAPKCWDWSDAGKKRNKVCDKNCPSRWVPSSSKIKIKKFQKFFGWEKNGDPSAEKFWCFGSTSLTDKMVVTRFEILLVVCVAVVTASLELPRNGQLQKSNEGKQTSCCIYIVVKLGFGRHCDVIYVTLIGVTDTWLSTLWLSSQRCGWRHCNWRHGGVIGVAVVLFSPLCLASHKCCCWDWCDGDVIGVIIVEFVIGVTVMLLSWL